MAEVELGLSELAELLRPEIEYHRKKMSKGSESVLIGEELA
jgi:hypothetical protein